MSDVTEKSLIVAVFDTSVKEKAVEAILEEMSLLTRSAGGQVIAKIYQKREKPDRSLLMGKGKAEEVKEFIQNNPIDLVIFCNHLNQLQQRNLENILEIKVIDRTRLILDIFATRARSLEGKLQVELAQLLYLLPRLTGKGIELSRLGGGIGTRGPGETKLEVDRRRIKKRISIIKNKLDKVILNRDIQRKKRSSKPVPVVSMVGYTSAGKSTLFETLTGEVSHISRMLFTTLDPVMRRVDLGEIHRGYYFLLSDTVGFIREMPKELFDAFKATLEEMIQADIILHVIDFSNPDHINQQMEVQKILDKMEIPPEKIMVVYNKIDRMDDWEKHQGETVNDPVYISAKTGEGILKLKERVFQAFFSDYQSYSFQIPANEISLKSLEKWAIVLDVGSSSSSGILSIQILSSKEKMLQFKETHRGVLQ